MVFFFWVFGGGGVGGGDGSWFVAICLFVYSFDWKRKDRRACVLAIRHDVVGSFPFAFAFAKKEEEVEEEEEEAKLSVSS